jgi:SAM domain (Sterile alpha motif)
VARSTWKAPIGRTGERHEGGHWTAHQFRWIQGAEDAVGDPSLLRARLVDVGAWLQNLGLGQFEAAIRDNAIDGGVLPSLTADDLKDIGVAAVGHRRKLLDAIVRLRAAEPITTAAPLSTTTSAIAGSFCSPKRR